MWKMLQWNAGPVILINELSHPNGTGYNVLQERFSETVYPTHPSTEHSSLHTYYSK